METNWGSALGVCAPEHLLQLDKRDLAHLYRQLGAPPPPPPPLDEAAGGGRRPPPDLCRRFETMLLSCRLTPAVAVVDSLARVSSAPEKRAQVGVDTIDTHTHTHTHRLTHTHVYYRRNGLGWNFATCGECSWHDNEEAETAVAAAAAGV
jgi:hypothetical protein